MGNVKKINENINESVVIQSKYVSDCFHSLYSLKTGSEKSVEHSEISSFMTFNKTYKNIMLYKFSSNK